MSYDDAFKEITNSRTELAARVRPFVSAEWIARTIFKFNPSELEKCRKLLDQQEHRDST